MPPRRGARRRTKAARSPPTLPRVTVERAHAPPGPIVLREDPHAHIVCRSCGRIQAVELTELDLHFLTRLAEDHPEGWSVDGISYSLTGACRRCREGRPA